MRKTSRKSIDLTAAIQCVADQPAAELTLAELIKAYNGAHLDGSDLRLRKWTDAFGHLSAWEIQPETLEIAALAMLEHGYSPATANRDLSGLGSVYRWARDKRLAPRGFKSPTVGIRRFEEPIRRVHIDKEQLDRLRARALASRDRRFGCFIALLIDSGARKSELLRRHWKDVDLDRREILATETKNGKPRVLFFTEDTADLLRRVYPNPNPQALVFEGQVPGEPVSFRTRWTRLTAELGLDDLRLHDLRHAAAANLLRAGVTLGVAAQVLGHDPAVLARRYGHLETNTLRRAQEAAWTHSTSPTS